MSAQEGNKNWMYRVRHGREKKYTPKRLAEEANAYFQWCEDNPLKEEHIFNDKGRIVTGDTNKLRPFTLEGLCNHLDITMHTFRAYESADDFIPVTTRIRQIIDNQQFEGAATGLLNANIIARKLGLADKKDHTTDGESLNKGFFGLMQAASVIKDE